ncbi:DNA topoisomerase 2 [Coniosporium apollinis]|uniref:DNA topoisomerase 2 n=1 Tax=Coniosporium apollinis TaxID=61459 RepID=A0ABQ9P233_9PEZI|nr:DNA topoisomerase 2 [Coniosporium apollinis]
MDSSVFEDGASSDFEPEPVKAKPKAATKKPVAAPKPKAASKKLAQTTLKPTKTTAAKKRPRADSDEENSDAHLDPDSMDDDSLLSNTPPSAKKQKKAPVAKKPSSKPLQQIENESFGMDGVDEPRPNKAAPTNATDRYQKLTQLEHIIKRPDTYIGSVERTHNQMWVFNSATESMEMRDVSYVPGLYKIFDEILVNAADNKQNDKNMNEIKVTVDRELGEISVRNNGKGIPIEIHGKEGIYVPEMIFGHLLTSSNYDDDQQKVTGGRNGYGAKLCNVFSTEFTIETADSKAQKKYKQTWTDNMSKMGKAKITANKGDDFTKVTFKPDFEKFKMDGMDDDFEALAKRRVYDIAGTLKDVKVYLNGERIKVNSFKKYMEMYTKAIKTEQGGDSQTTEVEKTVILTDKPNERWEVGFAVSDGSFQQVSFVNSIATTSGGTHVNYIADQIVDKLMAKIKKMNKKGIALKPNQIKNHIFLFVNCLIVNPAFNSQTKEQLTTKASQFGSKCPLSDKFLDAIGKTEAVTNIMHFAQQKADQLLKKSDGGKRTRMNNPKLTDANKAGTKDGWKCTLILTEGDSASALALAGRAVVNPDLFGVFPLRGKMLNVRDASIDQISKNAEIQNIKKFMGLQHKKEYTDTHGLRYGHLMIMTDQDHDGSHIKGLLINFFQVQFPSLLKLEGFLMEFITPIVKVWKGDVKHPRQLQSFFTMPEYEAWKQQPGHQKGWDHKYFKGLGTSSTDDAQVYFRDLDRHLKEFHTMKENEAAMIDLAFSKKKADARKEWLRDFEPGTYLDMTTPKISYDDFVNKELILFSMADNLRSIPSVVDGLKPGQRKVMYTCFRRNLKKDIKVVELAGSVSGLTNYSYGEASLQQTIVGLAQNFVGSNNINCLEPSGNFGSRLQGGGDAASARYIYTRLSPFARRIFHASDEPLLTYNEDDGKTIEPHVYVPTVPMILINGADGIGTGWSTSIPNYKPEDIVDNLKRRMSGTSKEDMIPMKPWFRGWGGETEDIGGDRYKFSGTVNQTGDNEVEITELPVRVWTQDFKDRLEDIIKAEKVPSFIKDYTEYNTPTQVHFIVKLEDKQMKVALEKGLEETFKLTKTMATSNLVAFDAQGRIHKYASVLDIMEEFYHVRLKFYEKRKQHLLNEMQRDLDKMTNQARFVKMIIDNKLVVSKKKKAALVSELQRLDFKPFPKVVDARKEGEFEPVVEDEEDEESDQAVEASASAYDYLLGMAIWSLTQERVDRLLKQIGDKEMEIDVLIKKTPKDLWTADLDAFIQEWHDALADESKRAKKLAGMGRRASGKLGIGAKGSKKRKAAEDSDDEDDGDFAVSKKKAATKPKTKQTSLLTSYLAVGPQIKAKPSATQALLNGVASEIPDVKPPAFPTPMELDGAASQELHDPPPAKKRGRPAGIPNKKPTQAPTPDSDDEDDVFAAVAAEAKSKPAPAISRAGRGPAKKPKYVVSSDSDSDNGDDLLGDVSAMVKGVGSTTTTDTSSSRALFSASTRPGSAQGISRTFGRPATKPATIVDLSDGEDETDYTKLVPQPSPQKPNAARTANETILSDDDHDMNDSDDFGAKAKAAPPAKRATSTKPAAAAAKPAPKPVPKKATASTTANSVKKLVPLSPAAKAYAAKQAKAQAGTAKRAAPKKKVVDSDSESERDDGVAKLANDILSDEDEEDDEPVKKPAAAARPGRRAAAAKPAKYVVSDDEDEESEEESFVVDDDSE